jgi:hypothetical protein
MRSEALHIIGPGGRLLHIEFVWRGDRYGHVISEVESDGTVSAAYESVEGTSGDNWPPSPPLQSLTTQQLPDGRRVALLVGMAGRSHWSLSVEPEGGVACVFDVACRIGAVNPQLGSRYRLVSGLAPRPSCETGWTIASGARLVTDGSDQLEFRPDPPAPGSGTVRWRYRVSLSRTL